MIRRAWLGPAVATAAVVAVTVPLLRWQGRLWWCERNDWSPWSGDAFGPHNSQHLFDPYTLTHLLHGVLLCGLLWLGRKWLAAGWRLVIVAGVEAAWEVAENSPAVIDRYRAATAAVGYSGDTVANSVGDQLACLLGFGLATRLGLRWSVAVVAAAELLMLLWIRDNLTLNVLMLVYPVDAVRAWQGR